MKRSDCARRRLALSMTPLARRRPSRGDADVVADRGSTRAVSGTRSGRDRSGRRKPIAVISGSPSSGAGDAAQIADDAWPVAAQRSPSRAPVVDIRTSYYSAPPTPRGGRAVARWRTLVSFIWPAQKPDLMAALKNAATVLAMDSVPASRARRNGRADPSIITSPATAPVIEAANVRPASSPARITAAGKIPPAG